MPLTLRKTHPWDLAPKDAITLQESLNSEVKLEPLAKPPRTIGGVDVGFPKGENVARAAVVVLETLSMKPIEAMAFETPLKFPYIPGLLSLPLTGGRSQDPCRRGMVKATGYFIHPGICTGPGVYAPLGRKNHPGPQGTHTIRS